MKREDANQLVLTILVVVTVALVANCVWMQLKCKSLSDEVERLTVQMAAQSNEVAAAVHRLEAATVKTLPWRR